MCVCVCVRACVRAGVRACVRANNNTSYWQLLYMCNINMCLYKTYISMVNAFIEMYLAYVRGGKSCTKPTFGYC